MEKEEMIEIIREEESNRWKEFENAEETFGEDSYIARKRRAEWAVMFDLCEQLHIKRTT